MDIFDQYIFDDLVSEYNRSNLTDDDYEEIYTRFCNMEHLEEVQPYLLTMRFFGLGTPAERDAVLAELKEALNGENYILKGLYYDLLLSEKADDTEAQAELIKMAEEGYTNIYIREKSYLNRLKKMDEILEIPSAPDKTIDRQFSNYVSIKRVTFECREYSGTSFTADDIDYLNAVIFIEPFNGKKHIRVKHQIFTVTHDLYTREEQRKPFSREFYDEYDIDSNTDKLKTTGWGNKNFSCYRNGFDSFALGLQQFKWVMEIDGYMVRDYTFFMCEGRVNHSGRKINDVEIISSTSSSEPNMNYCGTAFDSNKFKYLTFKLHFDASGETSYYQVFIKVVNLEDNSIINEHYNLEQIYSETTEVKIMVSSGDHPLFEPLPWWKKGTYQYYIHIGKGPVYDGVFTVY